VYQFHGGVDYGRGSDYPYGINNVIHTVESGKIIQLHHGSGGAGWMLTIQGQTGAFQYMHLFDDLGYNLAYAIDPAALIHDNEGNYVFAETTLRTPTSKDPDSHILITLEQLQPSNCLAIIFWFSPADPDHPGQPSNPRGALSPCPGLPIGDPSFNRVTQNTVVGGEMIGMIGESGAAAGGPHLHLQVNDGTKNELLYVQHDHSDPPSFGMSISQDSGTTRQTLDANQSLLTAGKELNPLVPFRIRARVDYSTTGRDLDQVQILMYKEGTAAPNISDGASDAAGAECLRKHLCTKFVYGGTNDANRTVSHKHCSQSSPCDVMQAQDAPAVGDVYPQRMGVVDFITPNIPLRDLDPGDYTILVRAVSVLGGVTPDQTVTVKIQPPQFEAIATCEGPFASDPDSYGNQKFGDVLTVRERLYPPLSKNFFFNIPSITDAPVRFTFSGWYFEAVPPWVNGGQPAPYRYDIFNDEFFCVYGAYGDFSNPPYRCVTNTNLSPTDSIEWTFRVYPPNPMQCSDTIPSTCSPLSVGTFSIEVPSPQFPNSDTEFPVYASRGAPWPPFPDPNFPASPPVLLNVSCP
jgi:hypothetical protein